jgi:hypothetical protein
MAAISQMRSADLASRSVRRELLTPLPVVIWFSRVFRHFAGTELAMKPDERTGAPAITPGRNAHGRKPSDQFQHHHSRQQ